MRWVVIGLSTLIFTGCGAKYRPKGPVMSDYERSVNFPAYRNFQQQIGYGGKAPKSQIPPLPFLAYGAAFEVDFALMPKSDEFDMIEVVRLARPNGPLWLAVETNAEGDQTLVASIDDIEGLMPEIPLSRTSVSRFRAEDTSDTETVDVSLSYINSRGSRVDAKFEGDAPVTIERKRNGRTYDYAANQLLAVVDIASQESLFKADLKIDGADVNFRKVGGLVPGRFVQSLSQGGIAVARYQIVPDGHAHGGADYGMAMIQRAEGDLVAPEVEVRPSDAVRLTVAQNFSTVQGCYLKRATDEPELGGPLQVDFNIDEGVVISTALPEIEGGITDEVMTRCITRAVDGWSFDDIVTGTVSWTFTFTPAGDEDGAEPSASLGEGVMELENDEPPAPEEPIDLDDLDEMDLGDGAGEDLPDEGDDAETDEADADPAETQGLRPELALKNFTTVHTMPSGNTVSLKWIVTRRGDTVEAVQTTPERTLTYTYRLVSEAYLELVNIRVEQYGRGTPVTAITFNPPIPDYRWEAFGGKRVSDFVIDVNGQQNFSVGKVETAPGSTGPRLLIKPAEPKWAAERPLLSSILFPGDGTVNVLTDRVELEND